MLSALSLKKVLILVVITAVIVFLFLFNPENTPWFPKCWFHQLTGFDCPACGAQRAFHQLFHLNFASALRYNPFMIVSFPYLAALIVLQLPDPYDRLKKLRAFCYSPVTIYVYLVLVIVWWIVRNMVHI